MEGPNCLAFISPPGLVVIAAACAAAIATGPGVAVALHGGWVRLFLLSYYIHECWAVERDTFLYAVGVWLGRSLSLL